MITHVVLFWIDKAGPISREELLRAASRLSSVPGVENFRVGAPVPSERSVVDDSFDVAISMDFADAEAAERYQNHPEHQAFVRDWVKDKVTKVLVYDFKP
jgi:hypothetical protein